MQDFDLCLSNYTGTFAADKHAYITVHFLLCQGLPFPVHLLQLLVFAPDLLAVVPVGIKRKKLMQSTMFFLPTLIFHTAPVREERIQILQVIYMNWVGIACKKTRPQGIVFFPEKNVSFYVETGLKSVSFM